MPLNQFQQGQSFANQLAADAQNQRLREEQIIAAQQQREARNALAEQFGPGAADPAAFSALTNTRLRQQSNELQQNAFQQSQEQENLLNQQRASLNAALALDNAIDSGVDPAQAFDRLTPILPRLGLTEEQSAGLREAVTQNPAVVKDIVTALRETLGTGGASAVSNKPAAVQEFEALTSGLSPEEVERAKRVELGIAARAGQARIVDINGVPTFVDPSTGTRSSLNAQQVEQARNAGVPVPPAALEPRQEALSTQEAELQAARRFEEVESLGKATGKAAVERLGALLPEADSGVESINVIDTLAETVEQGIRTGSIAEARQEAARALATFTGRDPSEAVANTDVFLATVGQQVAQNIRAFGAGTGLSDADREFARQMAGGNINASPEAILRILDINRKAAVRRVEKYNNARDAFVKRNPDFEEVFESLEVPSRGQVNQAPADFVFNPETGRLEPQ